MAFPNAVRRTHTCTQDAGVGARGHPDRAHVRARAESHRACRRPMNPAPTFPGKNSAPQSHPRSTGRFPAIFWDPKHCTLKCLFGRLSEFSLYFLYLYGRRKAVMDPAKPRLAVFGSYSPAVLSWCYVLDFCSQSDLPRSGPGTPSLLESPPPGW